MRSYQDVDLVVRLASRPDEIERCRALARETYQRDYGVLLTDDPPDPNGFRERFPDRFVMGLIDAELVACAGLYVGRTYVEQFGRVTEHDLTEALRPVGRTDAIARPRVEYTKVVVRRDHSGRGLGRRFIGMSHAREFLAADGEVPLLLVCARVSTFALWNAVGIHTRPLRPFPWYRNHERYRSVADPMESRLVIPELDIDRRWYETRLSNAADLEPRGAVHAI